jgi:mRNA turnover protein 4
MLGRNKVMAKAMGTNEAEEFRPRLSGLSERLTGNVGLLFTNEPVQSVVDYFDQFERQDYARGGFRAPHQFIIPAGPVMLGEEKFPNSMEPQLRALGVTSSLKNGVVTLAADYVVCCAGDKLTHEQARLLVIINLLLLLLLIYYYNYYY